MAQHVVQQGAGQVTTTPVRHGASLRRGPAAARGPPRPASLRWSGPTTRRPAAAPSTSATRSGSRSCSPG